ncbi:leucine-rich repeat-containing protein 66 [Psammomys obesus]|uniref:leucine-rich repeat-containing protein 66 n=1 Tax=Psammomys obesus TaxID=48139 RepID=UPI0024533F2D|nr:leucine-rich repeat-containing protein 66 [Psammomys obesus]XP_055485234.1 leucine-rich repeat-containing protein 66 [Psammomys obesus]XP_055485235.1 leucine-rich repeat-containing protein 66 [Psammomys obesus]
MKDLYVRVTTIVIVVSLCFTRTATNPSRKSSIALNSEYQWDGYLLANCWPSPRHSSQRADTMEVSLHFLQALSQSYTKGEWQIRHLDLRNHRISKTTLRPWAHVHALETLKLSDNTIRCLLLGLPPPRSSQQKRPRSSSHRGCPRGKVLILQRNPLSATPKGLWKLKSLQSLDLSFNGIVHVGLSDFHGCLQLKTIYLKKNKIRTIHPDAFKGLKKLQVVDLRSNALTTPVPIVAIVLELPHLKLDLPDNQSLCGENNASFQNITSVSWREKWNAICNMSVGMEKPYLETPRIRISRDTHLPRTSDLKSLIQSTAERPQEGTHTHRSTLGKEARVGYGELEEIRPQPSVELRDSQDEHVTDREDGNPPNLVLAVCLSVFITFVVAFFLGVFARPYIDRLWSQGGLKKRPGSDNAYSNEGFYDDIEAAQHVQHQGTELRQASHHLNLYENQNPSWLTEPVPHGAVLQRMLGSSRVALSSQQSPVPCENNPRLRSGDGSVFPNGHAVHTALHGLPNTDTHQPRSAGQDRDDVLKESHYDTVAQEYSSLDDVMDGSSIAGPLRAFPSSIDNGWGELQPSRSRDAVASFSNTQGAGNSKERGCPEPLGAMGSQMESSEERQASSSIRELARQQPCLQEADAEERLSNVYSKVLYDDSGDIDLRSLMPRWGAGLRVAPVLEEPVQGDAPFDPHYDLEANYESDSDEGSLFTLSSEGSEDMRGLTEEQASVENGGSSQTLPSRTLEEYKDNVTAAESAEDVALQRTLEKCETGEAQFGNPLISGPDSCLCETHLESGSNSIGPENISTWIQSSGHKLSQPETQGTFGHDSDMGTQSESANWHYSLRDLELPNVESLPSPSYCDGDSSDSEEHSTNEK